MLQLCCYYKFKPLKNKLQELMSKNERFQNLIHGNNNNHNNNNKGIFPKGHLSYIWKQLGVAHTLFSWKTTDSISGKGAFLSDSSLLGNFDIYESYVESFNGDINKQRQFTIAHDGTFGLFGIFLRQDLAMKYVHHRAIFIQSSDTLSYVIHD